MLGLQGEYFFGFRDFVAFISYVFSVFLLRFLFLSCMDMVSFCRSRYYLCFKYPTAFTIDDSFGLLRRLICFLPFHDFLA